MASTSTFSSLNVSLKTKYSLPVDAKVSDGLIANYIVSDGNTSIDNFVTFPNSADHVSRITDVSGEITTQIDITSDDIIQMMNHSQFQILTPSFILVCILLLLGIPGNLIALLVYITKMKRNTASYFIITLALSDLTNCLVSLPIELAIITNFWSFDIPWLCKISRFISAAMNNTSSFILVAIAVERFRSICSPLKPRFTSVFSKVICSSIVTVAVLSALPMIWGYGTYTYKVTTNNLTVTGKTCLVDDSVLNTSFPHALLIYFFVGHLIVFLILAVLYICIARKLLIKTKFQNTEVNSQNILLQRQASTYSVMSFTTRSTSIRHNLNEPENLSDMMRKVSRSSMGSQSNIEFNLTRKHGGHAFRTRRLTCMLFLVTSVFEISFIPYLVIVSLRNQYPMMYQQMSVTGKMAYQFFLRFYLINCAMNPIIYCFYNQNFRHGVKRLFQSIKLDFTSCYEKS